MTWPRWALAAPKNAWVAMAGTGSGGGPAVSATCPATGSGGRPAFWIRWPAPTLNTSVAAPVPGRQAVRVGGIPLASGLARSAEPAAGFHGLKAAAPANGAARLPDACPDTARPRRTRVARVAAVRRSARVAARKVGGVAEAGTGNPGSW